MTSTDKHIKTAKSLGYMGTEALNFTLAQQKQEREAQRLETKEAHEMEKQRKNLHGS